MLLFSCVEQTTQILFCMRNIMQSFESPRVRGAHKTPLSSALSRASSYSSAALPRRSPNSDSTWWAWPSPTPMQTQSPKLLRARGSQCASMTRLRRPHVRAFSRCRVVTRCLCGFANTSFSRFVIDFLVTVRVM